MILGQEINDLDSNLKQSKNQVYKSKNKPYLLSRTSDTISAENQPRKSAWLLSDKNPFSK